MARKKKSSANLASLVDQVKANLPNFLLGLTILVVFVLLSSLYLQGGKKVETPQVKQEAVKDTPTVEPTKKAQAKKRSLWDMIVGKKEEEKSTPQPKKHTVKEGESLWVIAETYYGSGFNAYDIASENKLENPDILEVGTEIVIPEVAVKTPTTGETVGVMTEKVTISGSEYVVKEGDSLWLIAQGAYGDGNAWTLIAQANNLQNPDVINAGIKLKLPR